MAKYEQFCSFCGKEKAKTKKLIAGPDGIFICDECVALCNDMLSKMPASDTPAPVELKKKSRRSSTSISSDRIRRRGFFRLPSITTTSGSTL